MPLDELVSSLLYEGYALYPYTPGATKNATPTPFGIVYPPAYAAECPGAFDHVRLECVLEPEPDATSRPLCAGSCRPVRAIKPPSAARSSDRSRSAGGRP